MATNIVYSNGNLDPWRGGGVLTNVTSDTIAFGMKESAHHLDLRLPNDADPDEVKDGRGIHLKNLHSWYNQWLADHPAPTSLIN
mmetsp:Transcript_30128/g.46045  ORF Transcript_30128/g.46045 Transcript_30128/m.46045 type:complete len:84 (+) Transcript_30128:1321-1572(+)